MRVLLMSASLLALSGISEAANCPTPPTKPTRGTTCQDPVTGYNITRLTEWASDGLSSWTRNDYSRRQAFNSHKSRVVTFGPSGFWQLYNATTYARIKTLSGPAGDAEVQWHPTLANKFYYMDNNGGLKLYLYDIDDDTHPTVADFTGRLPWSNAVHCLTGAEGSPSSDGRYWGFYCTDSGFNNLGLFTYDLQTDTIIATLTTSEGPNYVSMTPSGSYLVAAWWTQQTVEGAEGRTRAYTRDLTDWTWVDCSIEHSDTAIGANGHDYYVGVDYTSGGGGFTCSPANGYVFSRDINAGWVSHGLAGSRVDILPMYVNGTTNSVHISGRATSLPGRILMGTFNCGTTPANCPSSVSDGLFTGTLGESSYTRAITLNDNYQGSYWQEPHCSISKDGSKAICNSTWGNSGDTQIDVYIVDLPTAGPATDFYTLTPCRAADTRGAAGPSGGPALGANTTRTFPVAGICAVPSTAKAVAINVTVVNETNLGHLRLYPAGGAVPLISTINFTALKTRANNAVVTLGPGGEISVSCIMPAGQTDFVLDVTGYFE